MTELIVTEGPALQIPLLNGTRIILEAGGTIDSDEIAPDWDSDNRLEPVSGFRNRVNEARVALESGDEAVVEYLRDDPETSTFLHRLFRR